ncbi:YjbE family integral membrane protein [Actimicrobium sp. GrIS 1.19]|uniref:TerC family protein n=1 Tax=Actimicrobium sp. GrIS 1.19 TaxID=3071708 RepID=UPI002DF7AE70|nr:YjbE family integral membrane protein [Actimicrobium sp. GrIS 1.19]
MEFLAQLNWLAVGQIILIDLLLGGDNAIVIALACRNLPDHLRLKGILWGTAGAIGIRIVLITFAVTLLAVPYLKLAGGLMLLWIGVKLLSDQGDSHSEVHADARLAAAVKTIIMADLVMSIDNVIAVASAADQAAGAYRMVLVVFGILVSIPIVVWGSTLVLKLMERLPLIITFGAGLLGYLAGEMITSDPAVAPWLAVSLPHGMPQLALMGVVVPLPGCIGAVAVVLAGKLLAARGAARTMPNA